MTIVVLGKKKSYLRKEIRIIIIIISEMICFLVLNNTKFLEKLL